MKVRCESCGKKFDYEQNDGLCPHCSVYNSPPEQAAEQERQEWRQDVGRQKKAAAALWRDYHRKQDEADNPAEYSNVASEQSAPAEPARDSRRSQAVKQVLRRIRTDYAQPLTLAQLAAEAALEPKYFCRVFRQITGRTPIDYLNYYRVECAAELLCSTSDSVTEVALACGFGDVSYFGRLFRRQKGKTPGEYRRAFRG